MNCLPEDEPSSSLCSFVQRLNPFKTNVKRQKNKLNFTFDSENILTFFLTSILRTNCGENLAKHQLVRWKRANFYKAAYSNIDLFLNENTMIHVHCSRYIPDGVIISYELPFILKFIYPVESYLGCKSANLFSVLLLLQSDIHFFLCFLSNNVVYILIYKVLLTSQGSHFVLIREYILCLY